MATLNINTFSDMLNSEDENLFKNEKLNYDTKIICHWLYFICKILLSIRGVA